VRFLGAGEEKLGTWAGLVLVIVAVFVFEGEEATHARRGDFLRYDLRAGFDGECTL
jgi:hypothetical protein